MNVNMIHRLTEQHKALKGFHNLCNRNGVTLTVTAFCPETSETLNGNTAALIIQDIRLALLRRITETEESIRSNVDG